MKDTFELSINGKNHQFVAESDMPLLWVLRDLLELTGSKYSCGIGQCGACSVRVNDDIVASCQVTVSQLRGRSITTIEGLVTPEIEALRRAWQEEGVSQCGFCQSGQLMVASALLEKNPHADISAIEEAMSPVLCRCGAYPRILAAVVRAAELLNATGDR